MQVTRIISAEEKVTKIVLTEVKVTKIASCEVLRMNHEWQISVLTEVISGEEKVSNKQEETSKKKQATRNKQEEIEIEIGKKNIERKISPKKKSKYILLKVVTCLMEDASQILL